MESAKLLNVLFFCFAYATLNVTGTAMIKHTVIHHTLDSMKSYMVFLVEYKVIIGIGLNFLSMLVIMKALSMEKFSYVFPVAIGINFALTVLIGYFIFEDRLGYVSLLGIAFILLGIYLMSIAN